MTNTVKKEENHGLDQAQAWLTSVREMIAALETEDEKAREAAQQTIDESPLCVEVRNSEWRGVGADKDSAPDEYRIMLCTGGPAVCLTGSLDPYGQPETAFLQYQDWFTPWATYPALAEDSGVLRDYASCFYFGEG